MNAPRRRPLLHAAGVLTGYLLVGGLLAGCASTPDPDTALRSWADGATRAALVDFVAAVTTPGSPDFVPAADRIAVFDNDGTLWCEQPLYNQLAFTLDEVRANADDHPEWQDTEPFRSVLAGDMQGVMATGEHGLLELVGATHSGMDAAEFEATVTDWLATARHPRFERPYTAVVYQPMLELLGYLRAHGFETWIVSGGGVDFMRPWTESVYGIPPQQVVGSLNAAEYVVDDEQGPRVVKRPGLFFLDDKAGKPVGIHRAIGKRPILAVGNSDGDFQMLEWSTAGDGARLGVFVHHDDAEREYAYDRESSIGRLARGLDEADARGWLVVSMRDDWRQVFPDAAPATPRD